MRHDSSVLPDYVRQSHRNWWACESPERPPDGFALYDTEQCPGCRLALRAVVANGLGDLELVHAQSQIEVTAEQAVAQIAEDFV